MDDRRKTKQELIKELQALRQRLNDTELHQRDDHALLTSELFLKRSQEAGRIGSFVLDLHSDQESLQPWISTATMDDIFGIDESYHPRTGKTWLNLIVQREEVRQYFLHQVFNKHAPFEMEYQIVRPRDGQVRWILGKGELEFDHDGNPVRMIGTVQDITDRKEAEETLRASEAKYRLLYSTMRDAFARTELDGTIREFNEAFATLLGYRPEELKTLTYHEITPEKWHAFEAGIIEKQVLQRGYSDIYEKEYRRKDATVFPVELRTILLTDQAGKSIGMWAIIRDITERKCMAEALEKREQTLRSFFESSPVGIALIVNRRFVKVNPATSKILGYSSEELIGQSTRMTYPDDEAYKEWGKAIYVRALREGIVTREVQLRRKNGEIFDAFMSLGQLDPIDPSAGYIANFIDISERKQAEKAIQNSEKKLQALMETTSAGIYIIQDTSFIYANAAYEAITGYSMRELNELPFWSFIHPDFKELVKERGLKRLRGEITPDKYDLKIITKGGKEKWVELTSTIIDLSDKPTAMGSLFDISERKRIEAALRQSEERYRTILDDMEEGYLESDLFGNYTFANEASQKIFGYTRDELIGMNYTTITADHENKEKMFYAYSRMFTSEIPIRNMEWKIIRKDGSLRTCEFHGFLLKDINDHTLGFRLLCRDVTVRRQAEEEREKLITELQQALSEVKALSGLLPICSSCKKIRDDKGYWNQIEAYIAEHTEAQFSHGLCPECARKLYPKYFK